MTEVLLQRQNLANSPFRCECLTWCRTRPRGSCFASVKLPIGEKTRGGAFILGYVEGAARHEVISPVTGPDIVGCPSRVTARGRHKRISHVRVGTLQTPAQRERLHPNISYAFAAPLKRNVRKSQGTQRKGTVRERRCRDHKCKLCAQKLELGNVEENVLDRPNVIGARKGNGVSIRIFEGVCRIVDRQIRISESRVWEDASV